MVVGNISANISENDIAATVPRAYEIVLVTCLIIAAILAIFGNGIIILVETRNRCKTSCDWLILFMAANDLSCALINIPVYTVFHLGYWSAIGSDVTCKLHYYVEETTMFSSVLLLCIISVDRYVKTCRPHKKFLTPSRALRVCVIETVTSCVLMSPTLFVMIYDDSEFCSHIVLAKGILVSFVPMIFIFSFLLMFVAVCLCYSRIAFVMKNKLSLKNRTKDMASNTGSGALTSGGRPTSRNTVTWTYVKELYIKRKNKISPHVNNADQSNSVRNLDMITEVETVPHTYEGRIDNSTRGKLTNDVIITLKSFNQKSLHHRNTDKSPTVEQDANAVTWTEAKIYRTTKIMFFVTIVFVMSWIPTLAMFVIRRVVDYQRTVGGQVFALFARKAFLINTFTNPFFYIWMSSSFKERTRKTISVLFRCRAKNR